MAAIHSSPLDSAPCCLLGRLKVLPDCTEQQRVTVGEVMRLHSEKRG